MTDPSRFPCLDDMDVTSLQFIEDCGVDPVRQDDCHSTDPSVNIDMQYAMPRNVNLSYQCGNAYVLGGSAPRNVPTNVQSDLPCIPSTHYLNSSNYGPCDFNLSSEFSSVPPNYLNQVYHQNVLNHQGYRHQHLQHTRTVPETSLSGLGMYHQTLQQKKCMQRPHHFTNIQNIHPYHHSSESMCRKSNALTLQEKKDNSKFSHSSSLQRDNSWDGNSKISAHQIVQGDSSQEDEVYTKRISLRTMPA